MNQTEQEFLTSLEIEEAKLLTWGIVDGGFTKDELLERAESFLGTDDEDDTEGLIVSLESQKLLFELNLGGTRRYRTRMAESVRLFARLRQVLPFRKWDISPTLVGDFRFAVKGRRYPIRHISPSDAISALSSDCSLTPFQVLALSTLLTAGDRGEVQLAEFQLRATARLLKDLASQRNRGTIICAGTGTGKTLAFYLPALTHISVLVEKDSYWTKGVAIYPRSELLKDQFSETFREVRRLDSSLTGGISTNRRKLLLGTYYTNTPYSSSLKSVEFAKWKRLGDSYVCPFLRCPACNGELAWRSTDITGSVERLTCLSRLCAFVVSSDELILTRNRMAQTPPDILFTTTEMLNRRISDPGSCNVFGVRSVRPPEIVLLDEVHTYTGTHGAQVANLLRRWRHAVGASMQFTGLSATLRNAKEFFASLVGLSLDVVSEISANFGADMEVRGTEYQLALRGDPVSGTSLLSTTIQATMLMRRLMDPWRNAKSGGTYGKRAFVFTDDLDVTNRLFHNLLDAEGLDSRGVPIRNRRPLALSRSHGEPQATERLVAGQSWHICEGIGNNLSVPLSVGRTSSQDAGVDRTADVIVATASLEVGFNDPDVGAVIQHKAPRDSAQFLQRRGRAGRPRGMRPWTVVVLSDFGRDRLAYQGYDLLFDPVLQERTLPIKNRYVLRIQSVFSFIEWVEDELQREEAGTRYLWKLFSGPADHAARANQLRAAAIVEDILTTPARRESLERHLTSALSLTEEELWSIMWDPPRAMMTSVLPTLLRRLKSSWALYATPNATDYIVGNVPLPDFVPENLFSELNLPEVQIIAPSQRQGGAPIVESMPLVQAIREFSPGRVSRRFGYQHAATSHWIALPDNTSDRQDIQAEDYCSDFEEVGTFQYIESGEIVDVRCLRPLVLKPSLTPLDVGVTSNAFPRWNTQIAPLDEGLSLDFPLHSTWARIMSEIRYFVHNQRSHIEMRRFSLGSTASVTYGRQGQQKRELEATVTFFDGERTASIGFAQTVDGMVFRFMIPQDVGVFDTDEKRAQLRGYRTAYFKYRVLNDPTLATVANHFQREWLFQVYLSALSAIAIRENISLSEARSVLTSEQSENQLTQVLNVIFQTLHLDDTQVSGDQGVGLPHQGTTQSTYDRIVALFSNEEPLGRLDALASVLWDQEGDDEWREWLSTRFRATVGGAILSACLELCPQFGSGDLLLDLESGPRPSEGPCKPENLHEVWITEATLGGGGVIEEILRTYSLDPRRFFHLVEAALQPSDFEIVDSELTRILELRRSDLDVAASLDKIRMARSHGELLEADEGLRRCLSERGILVTHSVMTALNARVIRPGSSSRTDLFLRDLIAKWHQEEERLGIEIDARVFAYITARTDDTLDLALEECGISSRNGPNWRFNAIYGLLWPRGYALRSRSLLAHNPFCAMPEPDRAILLECLSQDEAKVCIEDQDWRQRVAEILEQNGIVSLTASPEKLTDLRDGILALIGEPIQFGFLHLFPQIEGFFRDSDVYAVKLKLREAPQ